MLAISFDVEPDLRTQEYKSVTEGLPRIISILNKHKVKYLIVGAYAVMYYTQPRYTKDIDIWVKPDSENAKKTYKALKEFGAPLRGISWEDFTNKKLFYQIGVAPVRIDVIMDLPGIDFDATWKRRVRSKYAGISINIMGIADLKKSKIATERPQDLLDLQKLKRR